MPPTYQPLGGSKGRKMLGLFTNRNPYTGSMDVMCDGLNREITQTEKDRRSPGITVYNSATWPAVRSMGEWKYVQDGAAVVRVLNDCVDGTLYDGTGPSTKMPLWQSAPLAQPTRFLSLDTQLFYDNQVEQRQLLESALVWKPNFLYNSPETSNAELGDFIVDPNGNVQQAVGGFTVGITNVAIANNVLQLTFDRSQLENPSGVPLGSASNSGGTLPTGTLFAKVVAANALGLLTAAGGESIATQVVGPTGSLQWTWAPVAGAVNYRLYVGQAAGLEDVYFNTPRNSYTQTNMQGIAGTPPIVNNAIDDSLPPSLAYMVGVQLTLAGLSVATFLNGQTITLAGVTPGGQDSNVITAPFVHDDMPGIPETGTATSGSGISGSTSPTWATTTGQVTQDGGAQWINRSSQARTWGIATPDKAPAVSQQGATLDPNWQPGVYYTTSSLITDPTGMLEQVQQYGTTGPSLPQFAQSPLQTTLDGSVVWINQGFGAYATGTPYGIGDFIQVAAGQGMCYFQAQSAGTTGTTAPTFPAALNATVIDGGVIWKNIGIVQQWTDITSSSGTSSWQVLSLLSGGTIAIGVGTNLSYGSLIPLPAGYDATRLAAWTTAAGGDSGGQLRGVASSAVNNGVVQTLWQLRSGSTPQASSNWIAFAWSEDADIAPTAAGNFTEIRFKIKSGDELVWKYGAQAGGSMTPPSGGYSGANFVGIVGMATVNPTSNGMFGVDAASIDSALNISSAYNDDDGNVWNGNGNVCGLFWLSGGGVTSVAVGNGQGCVLPGDNGAQIVVMSQQGIASGAAVQLPAGFPTNNVALTCSMGKFVGNGNTNVCHGWTMSVTGNTYTGQLFDAAGNYSTGAGNVFGLLGVSGSTKIVPDQTVDDSNGNVEQLQQSGLSSNAAPMWAKTAGVTTIDRAAVWINIGVGSAAFTAPVNYYYAYKDSVTKHVGTASPASVGIQPGAGMGVLVMGQYSTNPRVDRIVIFRPAQGKSTPLYLDEIANDSTGAVTSWSYFDQSVDFDLNPFVTAAIADENDPPPANMTAPVYHLRRIWAISGNRVVYSGGPDTFIGSGDEAFPPLNEFPFPATPIRLVPITVQNGGLLVFTDAGIFIILGLGISGNPFYATQYYGSVNLAGYNAMDTFNQEIYLMESTGQVSKIAPSYPFDPQGGYVEVGYAVNDQFGQAVTTGGITADLYDPASSFVTWNQQSSEETAMYVADGEVGWFRMSRDKEGIPLWHPRRAIGGGTSCVQSIETTPGKRELLIGPPAATPGPIYRRDNTGTVWSDRGTPYAAWDVKGVAQVCDSGATETLRHVSLKAKAVGARPTVAILMNELAAQVDRPWTTLQVTSPDPALCRPSESVFSDQYATQQAGEDIIGDSMQVRFDFGNQQVGDEMFVWDVLAGEDTDQK